ncbi:MAG: ABC transporter ATP-binding protein/permease [Clostridia bacterium]|nr:ABC transporter ATP-binding protein/permease [Clostridia bacterium]
MFKLDKSKAAPLQSPLKWLFLSVKSQGRWFYLNIACSFLEAVLVILVAYYMRKLVSVALAPEIHRELVPTIIIFLGLIPLGTLCLYVRNYSAGRISANTMFQLRNQLYSQIEKLPISYLESHHSAETVSHATNDVSKVENFLNQKLSRITYTPVGFIITFVYMLTIKWDLLLFSMIIIPATMAVSFWVAMSFDKLFNRFQELIGESNSVVHDTISGMPILKSFNLKDRLYDRYKQVVTKTLEKSLHIVMKISPLTPLEYILREVPRILCIIYGGNLIVQGHMTAGDLIAFLYLLGTLAGTMGSIPELVEELNKASGTMRHVMGILNEPIENAEECTAKMDYSQKPINVRNIAFSYNDGTKVLDNLSFDINKGSIVALVGPSGSGKSTIFKLLGGYYPPQEGSIELFGNTINAKNLKVSRSQISIVTQDSYLFPVSIAENISYGHPGCTMEEITSAAKAANAHDFIMELPEGYDTVAGERGARLSGGQKQRIAIARAILRNTPILMLDEPTSALDNQSEVLIQEAIEKLKGEKTIIIIAHRLSTIKNADEVLVLKEGNIVERGTHEQLMEKGVLYRQLYLKQQSEKALSA